MDNNQRKYLPNLFENIIKASWIIEVPLEKYSPEEIQKTFELCENITNIKNDAIYRGLTLHDAYKNILDYCIEEGLHDCMLVKHIEAFLYQLEVETDNDIEKGQCERLVLNDLICMHNFLKRINEKI